MSGLIFNAAVVAVCVVGLAGELVRRTLARRARERKDVK